MFPGNMNPKQMNKMLGQMGISTVDVDAARVVIEKNDGSKIIVTNPKVSEVSMQGQKTFQVMGTISEEEGEEKGRRRERGLPLPERNRW